MSALKKIKQKFREISLKKVQRKPNERLFINWDNVKHVQILFNRTNQTQADILSKFARFLIDEGKIVDVLIYIDSKKIDPIFQNKNGLNYYCRKHLNWFSKPTEDIYSNFVSKPSDLMIIADFENSFHFEWIAVLSKAKTIVAPYNEYNKWATLLIKTTQNNYDEYLQQMIHYLSIIKTK